MPWWLMILSAAALRASMRALVAAEGSSRLTGVMVAQISRLAGYAFRIVLTISGSAAANWLSV